MRKEIAPLLADAIRLYEAFLRDYPDHRLTEAAKAALARALVADAKASGAGEIAAPDMRFWSRPLAMRG